MHHPHGSGRGKGWGLRATLLGVALFALFLGQNGLTVDVAHAAGPGVSVQPGAGLDCGAGTCNAPTGGEFHLRGSVDTLGDLAEYAAFGIRIDWDAGLTLKDVSPNTGNPGGGWPDCDIPLAAGEPDPGTSSLSGCAGAASTYTGFVTDWTMNCSDTPGTFTVTMPVGPGLNTNFSDPAGNLVVAEQGTGLTINCGVGAQEPSPAQPEGMPSEAPAEEAPPDQTTAPTAPETGITGAAFPITGTGPDASAPPWMTLALVAFVIGVTCTSGSALLRRRHQVR